MSESLTLPHVMACSGCGNAVPLRLTVCPSCHALIHRAQLQSLAAEAEAAERVGAWAQAVRLWRDALPLLPRGSKQHDAIVARITAATGQLNETPAKPRSGWGKLLAPFAAVGAMLWKVKFLLAGLTKLGTVLSMLGFVLVYWGAYGWPFAVAIVVTIYIHEMGHVAALQRFGIAATAPMFVPGFGAYVRLQEHPATAGEDARVGLAGPIWGVAAAVVSLAGAFLLHSRFLFAVAHVTAVINLFNLTPIWQLDGGRGFNAMSRVQRVLLIAMAGSAWAFTRDYTFAFVVVGGIYRLFQRDVPNEPDWGAFTQFVGLLAVIAAVVYAAVR